jgi:transposase-like protein
MEHHLGTGAEEEAGNHRNGYGAKTVLTDTGKLELSIPRDRHGRFDPVLIGKYRRRFAGFDDKIIALYARGLTTGEIAAHVGELYGVEILAGSGERGNRRRARGGGRITVDSRTTLPSCTRVGTTARGLSLR